MSESTEPKVVADEADVQTLRRAARRQGFDKLAPGPWFEGVVGKFVKKHASHNGPSHWDRVYPGLDEEARARKLIRAAVVKSSMAGAMASMGAATGELLSLVSEGLAAPIGLPAAAASMVTEAAYTAAVQTELACDLASVYGVPFDPDDFGELSTLFGLAFEVEIRQRHTEPEATEGDGAGMTARLLSLEDGELAKHIGRKLLEESIMRNIVPVVGVAISARWNYVATTRFAAAVRRYVRYRRALRHACLRLNLHNVEQPGLILQGAWLLATVDGDVSHEELLALALILEALKVDPDTVRLDISGDDEGPWFEALPDAPQGIHNALLDVLSLVAATDRELQAGERRFLHRVARAIHQEIDLERIESIGRHLADGDDLPDGFLHAG